MLSYVIDTDKEMDEAEINELCRIIGIKSKVDIKDFLENDEEPRGFYQFFFSVLIEQDVANAIDIDWRWIPDDLFWQVQRYYPDQNIELLNAEEIYDEKTSNFKSWIVKFKLGNDEKEAEIDFGQPSDLLAALQPAHQSQFVEIRYYEDRYSWLIVPDTFDEGRFAEITGAEPSREPAPLGIDLVAPLTSKVFFYPAMVSLKQGDKTYGVYCIKPQTDTLIDWAGRILPGQTFREGIATELKSMFQYEGEFEFGNISFRDTVPDKQGNPIKRYNVRILLHGALDISASPLGGQVVLFDFINSHVWRS